MIIKENGYAENHESRVSNNYHTYGQTLLPVAGALVVGDAFRRNRNNNPNINNFPSYPVYKNGIFAPNAAMRYTFYDVNRNKLKTLIIDIDRQAKDRWQKLVIQTEIEQDGFYTAELVNTSFNWEWYSSSKSKTLRSSLSRWSYHPYRQK